MHRSRLLERFGAEISGGVPVPEWTPIEVTQGDVLSYRELYFDRHPGARERCHNGGVGAEALRWSFELVFEGKTRVCHTAE